MWFHSGFQKPLHFLKSKEKTDSSGFSGLFIKQVRMMNFDNSFRFTDCHDFRQIVCQLYFYCLVNGMWSKWSNRSACTKPCNSGEEIKQRHCVNPEPMYGGEDCVGSSIDSQSCNQEACPGICHSLIHSGAC